MTSFLVISLSNLSFSQEQSDNVIVAFQEINDEFVYSFKDQRGIPEEKIERFTNRINQLYDNIDSVTFDYTNLVFSIKFLSSPSKEELESVFSHFNVYEYTLN